MGRLMLALVAPVGVTLMGLAMLARQWSRLG
jgi:hypothetical protein